MPGYFAKATLKPLDGDDQARVIVLRRRKKTPYAPGVAYAVAVVTTGEFSVFATYRQQPSVSISNSSAGV